MVLAGFTIIEKALRDYISVLFHEQTPHARRAWQRISREYNYDLSLDVS